MKALQDLNRKNSQKSLEARKAIHSTNDTQTIPFNQISSSVECLRRFAKKNIHSYHPANYAT